MPAVPVHHTKFVDVPWDGGRAVAEAPNNADDLAYMSAWADPDGDPTAKLSYLFPHHAAPGAAANLPAVRNALSRLPQSRVPQADREAVEKHLRAHLEDASDSATPAQGG